MPPAAWNWFTSAEPFGIDAREQRRDLRQIASKSSQSIRMPAARAMAGRCSVWLVEPPVASRPTMPLTMALLVDHVGRAA